MFFAIVCLVFEIVMGIYIFNKDRNFGIMYLLLIIYCMFPAFARFYDNDYTNIVSHVLINDTIIIYKYLLYCFLFSLFLFVFFVLLLAKSKNRVAKNEYFKFKFIKKGNVLYLMIHVFVIAILFYNLISNWSLLSYYKQSVVKSNMLWSILLLYSFVFVVLDFYKFISMKNIFRYLYLLLLIIVFSIVLITCIKIGNRGILIPAFLGFAFLFFERINFKIKIKNYKNIPRIIAVIFVLVFISQFIRGNRGGSNIDYDFSFDRLTSFFQIKSLLFQDYTTPGNTLMWCIQNDFVDPEFALKSNIGNGLFFLDYDTIAEYLSHNIFAVGSWFGVGGFLPSEAYIFSGWFGVILIPLICVLYYKFYYYLISKTKDDQLRKFIGFLIVTYLALNIVRGQTYIAFKLLYMYIIPSTILYRMCFPYKSIKESDNG